MRLAIHSDLHYEFQDLDWNFLEDDSYDVLILNGDIATTRYLARCFGEIRNKCPSKPILYVAGNHCHYGSSLNSEKMKKACEMNGVTWLNRNVVNIGGVKFIGCTLWSTMTSVSGSRDPIADLEVSGGINDFRKIKGWNLESMIEEGLNDHYFLKENICKESVVITHFSPLLKLDNPKFPTNPLTNYFVNNYTEFFEGNDSPKVWIYGHTHGNVQGMIGNTCCLSNQRGYPREWTGYSPNYIYEFK